MLHLITGGSGFLGHALAQRLLKKNERIRTLDIIPDNEIPAGIEFFKGSVLDRKLVKKSVQGVDIVHHNAALVPLTKSGKKFWEVNVEGSRIVAEEAVKAGVKIFVHMSSSAIFGIPQEHPITSTTKPAPVEIYGRAKLAGENTVKRIIDQTDISLIIIRPRTILGNGRLGIFQILFDWIHSGKKIFIIGKGTNRFQFIHVNDLIDAYMLAVEKNKPGTYNIGTDIFGTLRDDLQKLIDYAQKNAKIVSLPTSLSVWALKLLDTMGLSPLAPWHYLTYHKPFYFDISPTLKLGWKPKYSNEAMLKESYDWFLKNRGNGQEIMSIHRRAVPEKILRWIKKFS